MAYSNRSDLNEKPRQPIVAPTAEQYGDRTRNEEAQRIAPLPATPPVRPSASAQQSGYSGPPLIALGAPTQYPDRPITHGLSTGPGPGPEALGLPMAELDALSRLKAMYRRTQNPDLFELILLAEEDLRG